MWCVFMYEDLFILSVRKASVIIIKTKYSLLIQLRKIELFKLSCENPVFFHITESVFFFVVAISCSMSWLLISSDVFLLLFWKVSFRKDV